MKKRNLKKSKIDKKSIDRIEAMNKLLKILIFIVTTSFISSHLYASEVVRLENKIFDNSFINPPKMKF